MRISVSLPAVPSFICGSSPSKPVPGKARGKRFPPSLSWLIPFLTRLPLSLSADTILSRMNAEARPSVMEAVSSILAERGVQGLFVGLGTRCLWSGSIISGQFLLYDVFRNLLHVTSEDLAQYMDVIGSFSN